MKAGMEFGLLGPLVVRRADGHVGVPLGKQRAVLAALLLNAGCVVLMEDLVGLLWGAEPPASARVTMQNYVKRLRRALGDCGRDRITTRPGGYAINVAAGELDVQQFEALVTATRVAARERLWERVSAAASAALSLWRGPPLTDVGSDTLTAREVPRLLELRLEAMEARLDAQLHLGDHVGMIPELRRLMHGQPLREHLHAMLMQALYRQGRQAEALAAYRDARRIVVSELGTEPGTELRQLHQRILAADPVLAAPELVRVPGLHATDSMPVVPRQLPGIGASFTGRVAELAELGEALDHADSYAPGTMVIVAISAAAGTGKTELAVYWAHRVADRFPDGQLYVDLRGCDSGHPAEPATVIRGFLQGLGVPADRIPPDMPDQISLYRSLLAGKKLLVVLDNASDEQQVRPLLPPGPGCVVLVTSRNQLTGLAAVEGARLLTLGVLSQAEACGLLTARLGERAMADPQAMERIADLCSGLPLTLAVAAASAAARPALPLSRLAEELRAGRGGLDVSALRA